MFTKLLNKAVPSLGNAQPEVTNKKDLDVGIVVHYGVPPTASIMAFDPIQRLLAIGTLDGRIKVIGGDNIEALLMSPKQLPYKSLEFLHNKGYLISISNENDIQVWDLELQRIAYSLQWDENITAFSINQGTYFMYVGDAHGLMSVLKYDTEERMLLRLPYQTPANAVSEASGISLLDPLPIVGILPQPCTFLNRVLIAYENGLIVLWDVSVNQAVVVRGHTDLRLKEAAASFPSGESNEISGSSHDSEQEEKVVCSLCWASTCGSILSVGYIDGDILLWNMSPPEPHKGQQAGASSNNVVKLQLTSAEKRLPVIVMHWAPSTQSNDDRGGQLFIYGGTEIGSEEVLTVLSIEWSSGIETVRCMARVDLTLNGSFADMILIPNAGVTKNNSTAAFFILANPGKLHVYDGANLPMLTSEWGKASLHEQEFPVTVPISDPHITISKIVSLTCSDNHSKALLEVASLTKNKATYTLSRGIKWPLTGGVPSPLSSSVDIGVEQMYIAGYQDGSVRIWDATIPVLSLLFVLDGEVPGIKMNGVSVSALEFCSITMTLAVGNECGLVYIYKLCESSNKRSLHFISTTEHKVHAMDRGGCCEAVFSIMNSCVRTLQFAYSGDKLIVGFECGQMVMLDVVSLAVLFSTDCLSGINSPIICATVKVLRNLSGLINSPQHQEPKNPGGSSESVLFILTRNAHVVLIDTATGNKIGSWPLQPKKEKIAISMYVIDGNTPYFPVKSPKIPLQMSQNNENKNNPDQRDALGPNGSKTDEQNCSSEIICSAESSDLLILLCCEDNIHFYSLKSVIQGESKTIQKVVLGKPCCWSTTLEGRHQKANQLILLYQTGVLEIRSLPELDVIGEVSLLSTLRWSFRVQMLRTISSNNGLIALVNGYELAVISLYASENDLRIPDSLPCLHDNVLAAAADAALNASMMQRRKQPGAHGIIGGIMKGIKGRKLGDSMDHNESLSRPKVIEKLGAVFSKLVSPDPSSVTCDQDADDLSIDDIEIDESPPVASSRTGKYVRIDEEKEREKLFSESTSDTLKPRMRSAAEIRAQYRKTGDVSSVAMDAKNKLAERQEKLERLSRRTEELQNGAENFASLAHELAKTMEARKWWQI